MDESRAWWYVYNPSTLQAEAEELKFETSLGYTEKLCLKIKQNNGLWLSTRLQVPSPEQKNK
jgi:hypothetical protein